MISRRKSGLPWALVFVAVALGLFATVFTVVQGTAGRIRAVELQKERQYVGVALANHSIDVARRLEGLEHAAHELAAVVIASPLITEAEFSALSAYLL
ncbi:MAG TPA: hypothetical protein VLA51_00415, partial [Paracoccaceae bacterium]|nr:hypothetical protein [Paracoccaceae bacterium]